MPLSPMALADDAGGEHAGVELYSSATTRVLRIARPAGATQVVRKEFRGALAEKRHRNESELLAQLAGIEGVAQLAPGFDQAKALTFEDRGLVALAQALRPGRHDVRAVVALAARLARILARMHRAGVVHRDINPANILVSPVRRDAGPTGSDGAAPIDFGDPVIIDFDLAMLVDRPGADAHNGQVTGTLPYLAPEQTGRTGHSVDPRADLYSLGATLYELACGRPPFPGQDTLQLIHDHLARQPESPDQIDARVPQGLSNIVMRLLAKAPEHRYQGAEGLLHDLQRLRGELDANASGVFELGERDFPARFTPPARLVARDAEIDVLQAAFSRAANGTRRTVLVEGAAGVGKSALVDTLAPAADACGGWLVTGRFDPHQKDMASAGGITQAVRSLGTVLLALPSGESAALRDRILQALGRNAGLVTSAAPEFAAFLGAQPEAPEIDPRQAEWRLHRTLVDLMGAVATPSRPLVLVLDNLQWAGSVSLRAFERVMNDAALRGVLLVGIYRDDETDPNDALGAMLARWREQPRPPVLVTLRNLPEDGLCELIARTLRLPQGPGHDRARELARSLASFTAGNPFDTVELLQALRREGVLALGEQGWEWDDTDIRHFVGRGNVVDLLGARIARLPPASREALESLSLIGLPADKALLVAATGLAPDELDRRLRPAIGDGLLLTDERGLRFRHDRVQQSVLATMDAARQGERQLAMARRLAGDASLHAQAAQQYLACSIGVHEPAEQRGVARLFLEHSLKLSGTANFLLAERYLVAAQALLDSAMGQGASADAADVSLKRAIDSARHAMLYSLGRLEEADGIHAALHVLDAEPLDLLEPTCLQMRSLDMRGKTEEAKALGLQMLARLGLDMGTEPLGPADDEQLDALPAWVERDATFDHSKRKQMTDRRQLAISKLLGRTVRSALVKYDTQTIVRLLLEAQRMWAGHGPCPELVACLGRMASALVSLRADYLGAYLIARHALTVGEALGCEPQASEARFIFATYSAHWFEPLENALGQATRAYDGVQASGDVAYSCYVHLVMITGLLEVAPTLAASQAEVNAGIALCQRIGNMHCAVQQVCERQMVRALRGRTRDASSFDDPEFSEKAYVERFGQLPYWMHTYCETRALLALIMGDVDALASNAEIGQSTAQNVAGYYMTVFSNFFCGMACAWRIQRDPQLPDRQAVLAQLDACCEWFGQRSAAQPYNFLHLLKLLQAERSWALGDFWNAAAQFDAAVLESESRQRPWHRALIAERAGLFQLGRGLVRAGRELVTHSANLYEAWGASAKVASMRAAHAFLPAAAVTAWVAPGAAGAAPTSLVGGSSSVGADAVDLLGILRASQALSSETSLESLIGKVAEVLASLTGATKVSVLSLHEHRWWLLGHAPGEPPMPVEQAAENGVLSLSAFNYAERTREPLLVEDAGHDHRFSRDPYFSHQTQFAAGAECSLLIVPIAGQGAVRAMLYLENHLGRAAFNAQRLDAVTLIAGQLAVSLANAQLYQELEERVHVRTRELQETQQQLVATARRAGKAEIANNVLHNVGNVLNSINVSASVVRRAVDRSKSEGLARAVALMKQHGDDLDGFIKKDPRGAALLPYLESLAQALKAEQRETLDELDRLSSSVDHIGHVVAAQQSNAGPSSVLEITSPRDVVEEALRLAAEPIARWSVDVVRRYEDISPLPLDKQRLLQVLVNLVANAAQAMEKTPAGTRSLTVGLAMLAEGDERRLRISVEDAGEGIAAEHLKHIFSHGFTTRKEGHGFGLHSSALASLEMGGKLWAQSEGAGRGATFVLDLPLNR